MATLSFNKFIKYLLFLSIGSNKLHKRNCAMANGFTQKNPHNNSISIHLSSFSTLASMEMEMSQIPDDMDDEATGFKLPAIKSLFGNQSAKIESTGRKASVGAMVSATSTNV